MECLDQIEHKGFNIKIHQDELCHESPRDWDNLGTMALFHRRYDLGDNDHNLDIEDVKRIVETGKLDGEDVVFLPVYGLDHSGFTINTSGFSCPWDSGQLGIIFVTKSKILKEYGWKILTAKRREKIREYLRNEVNTYNDYLTGNVYGYEIETEDGEHFDSCWGFYGDYNDYMIPECKAIIDSHIEHKRAQTELLWYRLENSLLEYVEFLR